MNDKVLTLLGFAAKAGKLGYGMDSAVSSAVKKKSFLAVAACDISEKSFKELNFRFNKNSVKTVRFESIDIQTLSKAVGHKCGIISINDKGFAEAVLKAYTQGGNANDE